MEANPQPPLRLMHPRKGRAPLNNFANAVMALGHSEWKDRLAYDEMMRCVVVQKQDGTRRPLEDVDVADVHLWMQRTHLATIHLENVRNAIYKVARQNIFHPVRTYLQSLEWDGTPRLDEWLASYLGVDRGPYSSGVGRMFLIAMVARVMKPGCKVDYILVLEGSQGAGKSAACRILAGNWFSDCLPDLDHDQVRLAQHLRGKWLVEVAELSAMGKADAARLKAFLTRQTEQYTPKYAREEVSEPRQCVLIGTTNKSAYLRDETGARRFWPVKVGKIDLCALERDRDQLFAEAYHAYRADERWWPDSSFEATYIAPEQENRYDTDAWAQPVSDFLTDLLSKNKKQVTLLDVATDALDIEPCKFGRTEQNRVKDILNTLGWTRGKRAGANGRVVFTAP